MQYDDLLDRLGSALERGDVRAAEVERLLRDRASGRPDAASVLSALGLAVALAGVALLYAMGYSDLSHGAQLVTPFAFPAVVLAVAIALAKAGRPLWQAETAGLLGQVALAVAFVVAEHELNPQNTAVYGAVCALAGVLEVLVCHRAIGSVRLTGWGLSASIVALVSFGAAGVGDRSGGPDVIGVPGMLLLEAGAAAALTAWLVARGSDYAPHAARTTSLLAVGAALVGLVETEYPRDLDSWHFVLALTAVLTFVAAAVLRMDSLIWVGALASVFWLGTISYVVGDSSGAAGLVVLGGVGLVGLGALVRSVRAIVSPQ